MCQPCDKLATCPGFTSPSPSLSWDWLQHPRGPAKDKRLRIINEWKSHTTLNRQSCCCLLCVFQLVSAPLWRKYHSCSFKGLQRKTVSVTAEGEVCNAVSAARWVSHCTKVKCEMKRSQVFWWRILQQDTQQQEQQQQCGKHVKTETAVPCYKYNKSLTDATAACCARTHTHTMHINTRTHKGTCTAVFLLTRHISQAACTAECTALHTHTVTYKCPKHTSVCQLLLVWIKN